MSLRTYSFATTVHHRTGVAETHEVPKPHTVALYRNFPISTLLLWQSSEYAKGRRANPKAGQGA
jgi:hypothetical protein